MFCIGQRPQEKYEDLPDRVKEANHILYWLSLLDKGLVSSKEFEEMCIDDAF